MALKSSREGLRKELVDYLGNIIVDDNLRNEIVKAVGDKFVTPELLNENVNNLTMQITTESGERIEADDTLQNNITDEATAREEADTTLQNNINAETTAREQAISNLEELIGASALHMDLLWENASPIREFVAQTISLDLTSYKYLMMIFNAIGSSNIYSVVPFQSYTFKNINTSHRINMVHNIIATRYFDVMSNGIVFYEGKTFETYHESNTKTGNNYVIPVEIWGIK